LFLLNFSGVLFLPLKGKSSRNTSMANIPILYKYVQPKKVGGLPRPRVETKMHFSIFAKMQKSCKMHACTHADFTKFCILQIFLFLQKSSRKSHNNFGKIFAKTKNPSNLTVIRHGTYGEIFLP
jgi:hypothetical protein